MDREIKFYDSELQQIQVRRSSIWDARRDLQEYLIAHEQTRNENLDKLYEGHTAMLEKIYLRHDQSTELFATHTIDAGTQLFKDIFTVPIQLLMQYFKLSSGISPDKIKDELLSRQKVKDVEKSLNGGVSDKNKLEQDDLATTPVSP